MSKRVFDDNGWMCVQDNPITKVGVFPYLGSEIGAPEPDRVYRVYRPAEELQKQDTLDSFKLLPFVDEHAPLGSKGIPAEKKGIQGMIGEQVYFDPPYVRANIKVLSDSAIATIGGGKIELSPGYTCRYEFTPGVFDGEAYDAIQRDIRGNHLALVTEGRTGSDVAVQDHKPGSLRSGEIITIDTAELIPMEFTPEQLEQLKALIAEMLAAQSAGDENPDKETEDQIEEKVTEAPSAAEGAAAEITAAAAEEAASKLQEAEAVLNEVAEAVEEVEAASEEIVAAADSKARKVAMDKLTVAKDKLAKAKAKQASFSQDSATRSLLSAVDRLTKQVAELKAAKPVALDTGELLKQVGKRDELADRLSNFIGAFDYKTMTLDSVAKYGVEKLGLTVPKGAELVALDAWLHGRKPEHQTIITGDAAPAGDAFKSWESK